MMPATAAHHMRRVVKNANANINTTGNANATTKPRAAQRPRAAVSTTVTTKPTPKPTAKTTAAKPKPTATAKAKADPADDKTCALLLAFFRQADLARLYSREKTLANDLRGVVQQLVTERDDARRELEAMRRRESEMNTLKEIAYDDQDQHQRRDSFASTTSTASTPSSVSDVETTSPFEATPLGLPTTATTTSTTMFEKMAQGHANDPLIASMWHGLRDDPALASLHTTIDASGNGGDLVSRMRRRLRAMTTTKKAPTEAIACQTGDVSEKSSATSSVPTGAASAAPTKYSAPQPTMFDLMAKGNASDPELRMMWEGLRDDPALASLHAPLDLTRNGDGVVSRLRMRLRTMKSARTTLPTPMMKTETDRPDAPRVATMASPSPPTTMFDLVVKGTSSDASMAMMWDGLRDDPALASLHAPMAGTADGTDFLSRIRRKVAQVKARNAKIAEAKRRREDEEAKAEVPVMASASASSSESVETTSVSSVLLVEEASAPSTTACSASATRPVGTTDELTQTPSQPQSPSQPMTTMFDMMAHGHARDRLQSFLWESLHDDPALASLHTPIDTSAAGEGLLSRIRRKVREVEANNRAIEARRLHAKSQAGAERRQL